MKIENNVLLSNITAWKVGGYVKSLVTVETVKELISLITELRNKKENYTVIGETTNLLFTSNNVNGTLIRLKGDFNKIDFKNDASVEVGAGCWVPNVARAAAKSSLSGLEHTIGIPGTFGGLIRMNGGSQRRSISESIRYVFCLDDALNLIKMDVKQCAFNYRESVFKNNEYIILGAEIQLKEKDKKSIRKECIDILSSRRKKFPKKMPNCGSVFKSNPDYYEKVGSPGYVIEKIGMKGAKIGGAQISNQHANFIINNGGAKSSEIIELINLCEQKMKNEYGFSLEPEVEYVTETAKVVAIK